MMKTYKVQGIAEVSLPARNEQEAIEAVQRIMGNDGITFTPVCVEKEEAENVYSQK